jgi:cytochrome P450
MSLARAGLWDSIAAAAEVAAPTIAKGAIVRRPKIVALAEWFGLDDRAVRRMQKLRDRYGDGPVVLKSPGRTRVLLLSAADVKAVLDRTPEPFATATDEKRAALAHFEPKVALASHGAMRSDRRRFNENVLQTDSLMHTLADAFANIVREETDGLLADVREHDNRLTWALFFPAWYRIVRRVVLGTGAREDHDLTDMLTALRARGNWAFFRSQNTHLRERFHERLRCHLDRAETGSLAEMIAATGRTPVTAPSHQVAQWLFAFDPAGMATYRAVGLLAAHPAAAHQAREEASAFGNTAEPLSFLRATMLESLRLWPTTPAILRQTTRAVEWQTGRLPANATVMIFAPFFHRDEKRLDFAHRFEPRIWLEGSAAEWPLVPFSRGSGLCPARNFVPLIASLTLARLIEGHHFSLRSDHGLHRRKRLPGTLDPYSMEFSVATIDLQSSRSAAGLAVG